jgi:enoyl-CoA hydratase
MKFLKIEKNNNIAKVTISRPEALNALNEELLIEIQGMVKELESDSGLKLVILTGEGKAFVAGADIGAMAGYDSGQAKKFSKLGHSAFQAIENSHLIFLAAINGFALGGGLELALACDIRIASSKAKLGLPEVSLGLIPGFGGTQRLARIAGKGVASEWVFSGDMYSAASALDLGVVTRVIEPEEWEQKISELAGSIASRGPLALRVAKETIRKGLDLTSESGYELEAQQFSELFGKPESKEGTSAFLEKRKPNFSAESGISLPCKS